MSNALPFEFVPIEPRRSLSKPRTTGLTMVIDDGLPLPYMRGVLELAAPYIDLMKIKTGTARLYPRDKLVEKLSLYESFGIQPFLGGQFHEYVFATMGERPCRNSTPSRGRWASAPSRSPTTPCR
jgi:phosphosulfolactate synthase